MGFDQGPMDQYTLRGERLVVICLDVSGSYLLRDSEYSLLRIDKGLVRFHLETSH
jgi:hypothetical protein